MSHYWYIIIIVKQSESFPLGFNLVCIVHSMGFDKGIDWPL